MAAQLALLLADLKVDKKGATKVELLEHRKAAKKVELKVVMSVAL